MSAEVWDLWQSGRCLSEGFCGAAPSARCAEVAGTVLQAGLVSFGRCRTESSSSLPPTNAASPGLPFMIIIHTIEAEAVASSPPSDPSQATRPVI